MRRELAAELNDLLPERDLLADVQKEPLELDQEAAALQQKGPESLPPEELERLNRLLLEAAFPRDIESGPTKSVQIRYLGMPVAQPFPISRDDLQDAIKIALTVFMNGIAAPIGVFVAILVTASIIPNMFDAQLTSGQFY